MRRGCVLCFFLFVLPGKVCAQDRPAPAADRRARSSSIDPAARAPQPEQRVPMRERSAAEATFSGVLSAGILAALVIPPGPENQSALWRGGVLFDDAVRDGLVLGSPGARRAAATASDAVVIGLTSLPILLDALLMGWAVRGDPELAARILLINLEAHALSQGLTTLVKHAARRERPLARGCREDAQRRESDPSCDGRANPEIAPESFFSGHTSLAFTSAALTCLHHTELGLFGPEGDATMCATGMALATTVGLLRIASDRHYATDVILGAGVGILSGWLVPWLLHYDVADTAERSTFSATLAPMIDEDRIGMQLFGTL